MHKFSQRTYKHKYYTYIDLKFSVLKLLNARNYKISNNTWPKVRTSLYNVVAAVDIQNTLLQSLKLLLETFYHSLIDYYWISH